jgi:Fic family protein
VSKQDIQPSKQDIDASKKDFESFFPYVNLLKSANGKENAIRQAKELFNAYGFQTVFGRSDVCAITQLSPAAASSLLKKLQSAGVVIPVSGKGKGKYPFRKQSC